MLTFCKSSVRCIGICAAQLYMNAALQHRLRERDLWLPAEQDLVHLGASSSRNLRPSVSVHKSTQRPKPCHWPFMISRSATPVASCFISIAIGFTTALPCSAPHGTTDIQQPPVTTKQLWQLWEEASLVSSKRFALVEAGIVIIRLAVLKQLKVCVPVWVMNKVRLLPVQSLNPTFL